MEPKFSPPSKWGISGLKVIFFFPLLPLGAIVGGVVDFFLCKRGGEAGKEGFSANEKKAWREIRCGFFFQCGCNGHGALPSVLPRANGLKIRPSVLRLPPPNTRKNTTPPPHHTNNQYAEQPRLPPQNAQCTRCSTQR